MIFILLLLLGPTAGRQDGVVAEYFAKCWLCSKGFPSPAVLREHLHSVHNESAAAIAAALAALQPLPVSSSSSTGSSNNNTSGLLLPPSLANSSMSGPTSTGSSLSHQQQQQQSSSKSGAPHACIQCNATFLERDELERHELTHSPTAQVVNYAIHFSQFPPHFSDSPAVQIPLPFSSSQFHFKRLSQADCLSPPRTPIISPVIYTTLQSTVASIFSLLGLSFFYSSES